MWRSVLKAVKGVYLLVCKEKGKHYVGSANGTEEASVFVRYKVFPKLHPTRTVSTR